MHSPYLNNDKLYNTVNNKEKCKQSCLKNYEKKEMESWNIFILVHKTVI